MYYDVILRPILHATSAQRQYSGERTGIQGHESRNWRLTFRPNYTQFYILARCVLFIECASC